MMTFILWLSIALLSAPFIHCHTAIDNTTTIQSTATQNTTSAAQQTTIQWHWFDLNTRPQDDVYRFANGAWIDKTQIPDDKIGVGSFYDLRSQSLIDIKNVIIPLQHQPSLTEEEKQVLHFYQAFMDKDQIEKQGLTPLKTILDRIDALVSDKDLWAFFAKAQQLGIPTPFSIYVDIDKKQADRYALYFSQSGLGLPDRDYYFDKKTFGSITKSYKQFIRDLFTANNENQSKASAKSVYQLEKRLATTQWNKVDNRDVEKTYNAFDTNAIKALIAPELLDAFFDSLGLTLPAKVIIQQPDYLKSIAILSREVPIKQWKQYLRFQTLRSFAPYLPEVFVAKHHHFYQAILAGQKQIKPREERAILLLNNEIGELVGKLYVKHYFPESHKQKALAIVDSLKAAYKQSFAELDWMTEATKQKAHQKLDSLIIQIGYPDQWTDFQSLSIEPKNVIDNILRARKFHFDQDLSFLDLPVQEWKWSMPPQIVNAWYNPAGKKITFPAAILQPPFFDPKAEDALNYGAIGAVIGHEMGHAFDDQGRKTDWQGNLNDWWTKQDEVAFNQKAAKLVTQYDKYTVLDTQQVNGKLTLGENIGDLTGVSIALKAYLLSKKANKQPETLIEGFSSEQRFFLAWAQIWAVKQTDAFIKKQIQTDVHSPAKWRVNGPLSNIESFYRTFNVKPTDQMFIPPKDRASFW
ncbi:MAG: M13 family metallopeptidase [Cellvibrionales bacterium]|nr:M13 family metallopeptidase [Cellvibrionales bacterium]